MNVRRHNYAGFHRGFAVASSTADGRIRPIARDTSKSGARRKTAPTMEGIGAVEECDRVTGAIDDSN
jgi:hypothetical protein